MGSVESKARADAANKSCSQNRCRSQPSSPFAGDTDESSFLFLQMLFQVINAPTLELPYVQRMALLESIRALMPQSNPNEDDSQHQRQVRLEERLMEIIIEGVLTCSMLTDNEKDLLVRCGMLERRWDKVVAVYSTNEGAISFFDDNFLNYRRFFLVILKKSRKMQDLLPLESRNRIKEMILKTRTQVQLDDLLFRILERTCGTETKCKIMDDMASLRYYRLLWPDRLDCVSVQVVNDNTADDDRKLPATGEPARPMVYGSILLPDDLSHREDCCPICLEPIQEAGLQLSCGHVFCSRCIADWIRQNNNSAPTHGRPPPSSSPSQVARGSNHNDGGDDVGDWHCPVCRQSYKSL